MFCSHGFCLPLSNPQRGRHSQACNPLSFSLPSAGAHSGLREEAEARDTAPRACGGSTGFSPPPPLATTNTRLDFSGISQSRSGCPTLDTPPLGTASPVLLIRPATVIRGHHIVISTGQGWGGGPVPMGTPGFFVQEKGHLKKADMFVFCVLIPGVT